MRATVIAFGLFLCQLGCPAPQQPLPQPAVITDTEHCGPACTHLMELGCPEGFPISVATGDGGTRQASCVEYCKNTQDQGIWLNPSCVETITTCSQIEDCAIIKKK